MKHIQCICNDLSEKEWEWYQGQRHFHKAEQIFLIFIIKILYYLISQDHSQIFRLIVHIANCNHPNLNLICFPYLLTMNYFMDCLCFCTYVLLLFSCPYVTIVIETRKKCFLNQIRKSARVLSTLSLRSHTFIHLPDAIIQNHLRSTQMLGINCLSYCDILTIFQSVSEDHRKTLRYNCTLEPLSLAMYN